MARPPSLAARAVNTIGRLVARSRATASSTRVTLGSANRSARSSRRSATSVARASTSVSPPAATTAGRSPSRTEPMAISRRIVDAVAGRPGGVKRGGPSNAGSGGPPRGEPPDPIRDDRSESERHADGLAVERLDLAVGAAAVGPLAALLAIALAPVDAVVAVVAEGRLDAPLAAGLVEVLAARHLRDCSAAHLAA